jgi:hypothetical protein
MKFINKMIQKISRKYYKGKSYRELKPEIYDIFKKHGEGIYYANIWSSNNTVLGKIIAHFSDGISHTIPIIYSENFGPEFPVTFKEYDLIKNSWRFYYKKDSVQKSRITKQKCKTLILSADAIGIMACDFSQYQHRKISIRKVPCNQKQKETIISYLISKIDRPYDSIGLVAWLLGMRDDPYSFYCSEITYDAMKAANITIAEKDNPSPGDIENSNKSWIVYKSGGVK